MNSSAMPPTYWPTVLRGADCGPIRLPVCTSDGYVGYRRADSRLGAKARHAKRGAGGAGDAAPPADE
ncbi:hypothetical protein OG800_16195 [Streptomyces sp. NBC_00445]|uniref:hypothetical protein n=1 Tax=Streptomyces sp. NBC_00445 TaxID=2975745 RepID=UPI002E220EC6